MADVSRDSVRFLTTAVFLHTCPEIHTHTHCRILLLNELIQRERKNTMTLKKRLFCLQLLLC